jgi:hypothetical protein
MYKSNAPWGTPKRISTAIKKEICVPLFKTKTVLMRNKKKANNIR